MQVGHTAYLLIEGGAKGGAGSSLSAITLFEPGYRDAMEDDGIIGNLQQVMVTICTLIVG